MNLHATVQQQIHALIIRTDPTTPDLTADTPSRQFAQERLLVLSQWAPAAPDDQTLATMTATLDHYLETLTAAGCLALEDADSLAGDFLQAALTLDAWHLRKNTLMAAYNALRLLGAWHNPAPVTGSRPPTHLGEAAPAPSAKPGRKTPRNRVATNDEVLLARVSAPLDCTGSLHRRAAALAIACAGAATGEGAQVCWTDHGPGTPEMPGTLRLPGRHHQDPTNGWHIAQRTVALDPWSQTALQDWQAEASAAGRPLIANWSVVYDGAKELTHQSAKNSYDHHINLTLEVADLAWIPGLTSLSIGEWAAAHAALHHGLDAGAAVMGVDALNCLRKLTKADTRAYH
ncbi:hypothetical protein [Oryzihumus leptocrescens]|uniref:Uncharacterized protein n=1 Tax=Oryzihumus leptocrescens TaxID=297536 RepID=A0A542ZF02_9MICO|nr:hypothetical protein [Oryzihumus leptocrescens]TQL58926.1 hypothetical protein FB474_0268 [Oryzihumus leptocrescens]